MDASKIKRQIISAGYVSIEQLIKVAKEDIIKYDTDGEDGSDTDLSADKLKNAAATKKLAIFDAFEILKRIQNEEAELDAILEGPKKTDSHGGFAESRAT